MGIQSFYKWIRTAYPNAFKRVWLDYYDYGYIDINYSLHMCCYMVKTQDEIYRRLEQLIYELVANLQPVKELFLMADGPAPLAKLLLQRKRRLSVSRSQNDDEILCSSLNFTPGTLFMERLKDKIKNIKSRIELTFGIIVNIDIDGVDEAELKIKREIMKNPLSTHIVATNDADVVVMLSTLENYENAFIMIRENNVVLSVGFLLKQHFEKYGNGKYPGLDFSAVSIMMGNDYLPKINFVSLEKLWESYANTIEEYKEGLVIDRNLTINKDFFIELLNGLIINTPLHLIKKFKMRDCCHPLYENYIDGFMWCLNVYNNGKCDRYNYMYGYQNSPHPLALTIYIAKPNSFDDKNISYGPIPLEVYCLLLLPRSAKELVNKKYHNFMIKESILYEEESCSHCLTFHNTLSGLHKELDQSQEDENDKKIKKEITSTSKKMSLHKKNHAMITLDDIQNIINDYDKFKSTHIV